MASVGNIARGSEPNEVRMQMLYGVNQADQCREFDVGP